MTEDQRGGMRRMIDLKTGIVEIEGVVMGPDSKLEDFKKYGADLVDVDGEKAGES